MLFSISVTPQNSLAGWLAPDNRTMTPRFRIETEFGATVIEADCMRPDIVSASFHETGLVGFIFGDHNVPNITRSLEVVVTELSQNKVIFRKTKGNVIRDKKLFLFNNIPVPSKLLKRDIPGQFLLGYPSIDETGIETSISLIGNKSATSIFSEGRLSLADYYNHLKMNDYIVAALIAEPVSELANRLLVVKALIDKGRESLLMSLPPCYTALKRVATQLSVTNYDGINSLLASLTPEEKSVVNDPVTRHLGCGQNEEPEPRHVSAALNRLSELDAVGLSSKFEIFRNVLEQLVPAIRIGNVEFGEINGAIELEASLRASPVATRLLRNDLRLFNYIERSIDVCE